MATEWHYSANGAKRGPVSDEALRDLARRGSLRPDDLVWRAPLKDWIPASQVNGLSFPAQADPSPTQPSSSPSPSIRILRMLVVAEAVLFGFSALLFFPGGMIVDQVARDRGVPDGEIGTLEGAAIFFRLAVGTVQIPALAAAWYALYTLKRWGRWLYVAVAAAGAVSNLLFGLFHFSFGWELWSCIGELDWGITGAIVAIVYLTPAADSFANGHRKTDE
jgi:hypothetical protein